MVQLSFLALPLLFPAAASAQKVGTQYAEQHPKMPLWTCTMEGCKKEAKSLVLDANWRWVHNGQGTNCYKGSDWNKQFCPDPKTCSQKCHIDGATREKYEDTYGVHEISNGVRLEFVKDTPYGANYGSRLYLLEDDSNYKIFKLKNREFTMTVDLKRMPCGLNGAVYFVEMEADGGVKSSGGLNEAGAAYGTGYCDAQCPHDIKFIKGQANVIKWNATATPPIGDWGICCAEMDVWEANSRATAFAPHTCSIEGSYLCEGIKCGDTLRSERYDGVCDKDGCDFNAFRMKEKNFFGRGKHFKINSRDEMTVVTQFITSDGTDTGDLIEIRRFYVQDGKIIPNADSKVEGVKGNSITQEFCDAKKRVFRDVNDFKKKGGMKSMGEVMGRGMVLVFSLWDDSMADMLWLDSVYPPEGDTSKPGVVRGPCKTTTGATAYVRSKFPHASVSFSKIKFGHLNTTFSMSEGDAEEGVESDDEYGQNRRLHNENLHL
eukprot:TRINITY_DN95708_c0_g1_i1.p1 TRINITY_DN95708_c0_g1~~TRINITY_DN95708_c0_g1_i1.p1  ORF type:complete len:489 (-),score=81.95 TRINITY_DN95708_c0_g1_i1:313-1779(-)